MPKKNPKITSGGFYSPTTGSAGFSNTIDNPNIAKQEEALKYARDKMAVAITDMGKYQKEAFEQAQKATEGAIIAYSAGTVGALEQAIKEKQDASEGLKNDNEAFRKNLDEIAELQKQLDKITGKNTGNSKKKTKKEKDPVIEQIEQAKKAYSEYFKWVNAGYQNAAKQEFSELLKGGKTYLDYLNKMREDTSLTREQIHQINNEIAQETNTTVLGEFKKSLQEQLNKASSILDMLNVIEQKRKALETEDDDELKERKTEVLDKQQEDVVKKATDDYNEAKKEYSDYLDSKISADVRYFNKKQQLEKAIAVETNEDIKKILQSQLDTLIISSNLDYEKLLDEHRSFEQKKNDITKESNEKRNILNDKIKNGNLTDEQIEEAKKALVELENKYKKSLSDLSVEILQQSDTWKKLFTDLDTLTVSEMLRMKHVIEAEFNNLNLSPEAVKALRDQLDKVTDIIQKKNPFAALLDGIKKYNAEQNKANFNDMFESVAGSIDLVKGSFDAVVGSLKEMGIAGDEETQNLLGDISEMAGAAGNLAMGIATGNPLQIIQGGIGLITSAFEVFNTKDRNANRAIRQHAEAVSRLESVYKDLEHAVNNALGESVYKNQAALIENMRQQRIHLQQMAEAEAAKKKADQEKIKEYKEQDAELARQIDNIIADVGSSVVQTTAKELSNQLADALVEAYGKGEDAAKSFEEVSRQVIQNAVKNALKLQFLEQPIKNAIDQLQKDMGFDSEGNGTFDGLTQEEQDRFKSAVADITSKFKQEMEMYKDMFTDVDEAPTTSLSGAIKGASQESIDLLAGQTNAVRVNQVESIEILRNSLIQLTLINANTNKSSKHLESIDSKMSNSNNNINPLRSQGITG
jgi:hypothetical protein